MPVKKKPAPRKKTAPPSKPDLSTLAAKAMASVAAGANTLGKIVATAFTIPPAEPRPKAPKSKPKPKKKKPKAPPPEDTPL